MEILTLTHNDHDKKELFGWIGEACTSASVRNAMGAPITSTSGDVWLLAIDDLKLQGFCAITLLKSSKAKLHAFHSDLSTKSIKVESALLSAAVKQASNMGATSLNVVDYMERHRVYETQGWTAGIERGKRFCEYSKKLGGEK